MTVNLKCRIETNWGTLQATCMRPGQVTCNSVDDGGGQVGLLIEGLRYHCAFQVLRYSPAEAVELSLVPINDTWSGNVGWASLSPVDTSTSQEHVGRAVEVLRWHILPAVATWLVTAEAQAVLNEGTTWWRTTYQLLAESAQNSVSAAWGRLQRIQHDLRTGAVISTDDERFLQRLDPATYSKRIEQIGAL